MTIPELEEKILGAVAELREVSADHEEWAKKWATAEHVYRHSKAVSYLASSGTIPERTAYVDKACAEEREKAHTAEALREATKEKKRALETEISAYQTIAGLMRAEMGLAGRYEQ